MELNRRRFITVLGGVVAAPAIVRVSSLMPVRLWMDSSDWVPVNVDGATMLMNIRDFTFKTPATLTVRRRPLHMESTDPLDNPGLALPADEGTRRQADRFDTAWQPERAAEYREWCRKVDFKPVTAERLIEGDVERARTRARLIDAGMPVGFEMA